MTTSDVVDDRASQMNELLMSIGDGQSKRFRQEVSELLAGLPFSINADALRDYEPMGKRRLGEGCGSLPGSTSPRRTAAAAPEFNASLDLPALLESPIPYRPAMRRFPQAEQNSHIFDNTEETRNGRRPKLPKKPLAQIYQERVSPRVDNTPHIFSATTSTIRSGFSFIDTKSTKKFMLPNPPGVCPPNLVDISGKSVPTRVMVSPRHAQSAPRVIDVSPIESPRRTLKSKIRETLLHTGKTVQSTDARRLPTPGQRFEASYRGLFQPNLMPGTK